jgi:hypothetical protein
MKQNKEHIVGCRLTRDQYKYLLETCKKYDLTMSKLLNIIISDWHEKKKG